MFDYRRKYKEDEETLALIKYGRWHGLGMGEGYHGDLIIFDWADSPLDKRFTFEQCKEFIRKFSNRKGFAS